MLLRVIQGDSGIQIQGDESLCPKRSWKKQQTRIDHV